MNERQIEPAGEKEFGPCNCCGGMSRSVWGYVYRSRVVEAAYFVQWTVGHVAEHGAHVDLIIGLWGEGSNRQDRVAVSMEFRRTKEGPQLMVIDSSLRPVATSELVGRLLARSDVIGTSLAQQAYDIVDCLWLNDRRIEEITREANEAANSTR
jgi:hypothetical protein